MRTVNLDKLRVYMARRNLMSKAALAREAGVTRVTICKLFAGVEPKYETICGLIEALKIPSTDVGDVFYSRVWESAGRTDST